MGMKTWTAVAVLIASGAAFADDEEAMFRPAAGRDVVKPMRPDWCEHAEIESSWREDPNGLLPMVGRSVTSGYDEKALRQIGQVACVKPDDASYQMEVAKWRQGYINLVGASEAENRAAMKVRVSPSWEKMKSEYCESIRPGEEDSSRSKSLAFALAMGTGCQINGRGGGALDVSANGAESQLGWWLDERAEVDSEIVHAVYVNQCLRVLDKSNDHSDRDWPDPKNTWVMQAYATCGQDARRLDKAKLEKELADPKFNDFAKVNAREVFALAKTTGEQLKQAYDKLGAKDEAYRKLLIDAPETAWKTWEAEYAAHRDAFEAARAYERKVYGPSQRARLGCGVGLRKGFNEYIRSRKPANAEQARRAALDDIGYVLLSSLAVCDGSEGRFEVARAEVGVLTGDGRGVPNVRRGPRLAAYYAAASTLGDILADRSRFPIKASDFRMNIDQPNPSFLEQAGDTFANKLLVVDDPKGVISGVKPTKGGVTVSFKAVHAIVPNWVSKPNGRIARIESNGTVVYGYDVVMHGMINVTRQEPPLFVPAEVASGLAVGQTATFSGDGGREGRPRNGLPKEIYADKDNKKLLVWYGVKL